MDHAWIDGPLDAAIAQLDDGDIGPACAVLADARDQPELRALRAEVLGERLVSAGRQVLSLAMDEVNAELSLLAGAIALREAHVIAADALDPNAPKMVHAYLRRAIGALLQAAELLDADPVPHALLQSAAIDPDDSDTAWQHAIDRAPTLYTAHRARVDTLDATDALAFARQTAQSAGSGDPRVALVVYGHFRVYEARVAEHVESGKDPETAVLKSRRETFGDAKAPARPEIADLAQRYLAAARQHPRALEAHNLFAAAFTAMSDTPSAEPHLHATGGRVSTWAWRSVGGEDTFHKVLADLRDVRHPDVPAEVRNNPWF